MTEVRVWAPIVKTVLLKSGGHILSMEKDPGGWWSVDAPFLAHGSDYSFMLDGEGPFPDPRSLSQPFGVHGESRLVDHSAYSWNDTGRIAPSLDSAIIYELHVGTFTKEGTFESVIERLDHLIDLGVTHIELMPVAEFPGNRGWGYDGVYIYAVHHAYGGPEGLKRLVDACHKKGLSVLLDVVYNHFGPSGNYLDRFGPYFTDHYKTPWGRAVNLDGEESDEVRRFFIDNALMWLCDYHIDGLRVDAIHAIVDTSAIHFLEQLSNEVRHLETLTGRNYLLIAESDLNDPRVIRKKSSGGYGFDAMWNEDFHHSLHALLTGERQGYYQDFGRVDDLRKVMTEGLVYDGRYSVYRKRSHGRSAKGLSGHSFICCLQNHDQVGNRATGDRIGRMLTMGQLKTGAALTLTAPFVPMLFQGEEWGATARFLYFIDYDDEELVEAVRRGRMEEFKAFKWDTESLYDPQDNDTYNISKLDWDELTIGEHAEMLEWYKALIKLRRDIPALTDGDLKNVKVRFDEASRWLTVSRGSVLAACNFSESNQLIRLSDIADKKILLSSHPEVKVIREDLSLPGNSVVIMSS